MTVLFKTLQVILALSLLIILHEAGHFAFARIFHIRVEKFYLFFDIGGKSLLKFKLGGTEFGIGWLPFGGYCKISGMIDESMDLAAMKETPKPWEFRTHPAWQRLFVMAGGVLNNFIFAILAYAAILGIWGSAYIPNDTSRIYATPLANEMGFRTGDRILRMDDYVPTDFSALQADLVRREVREVSVLRDGDTLSLYMDHALFPQILNGGPLFGLAVPFKVDSVIPGTGNDAAIAAGDRIVAIDGTPSEFFQDASAVLFANAGRTVTAEIDRDGVPVEASLKIDSLGHIGVFVARPDVETRTYGVLESIPAGAERAFRAIADYLKDLKLLAKPSSGAYKSVGSFIAIGQVFPSSWDWYQFMEILALLSVMLGVVNLIPIPGLDGGHILFTIYEIVTGRKPSDKFLAVAQSIGMLLLLMLMFLAFGNDIGRLIR